MTIRGYWTIDSEHDAAHSVVAAAEFIKLAHRRPHYWKWFVLAMHSALQGALTLALHNDNTVLVQKPGVSKKMLAAFAGEQDFPAPYMDNFLNLYSKAQSCENLRQGAISLPISAEHTRAMAALDELRDEFTHFNHKTWSIERSMLVECPLIACEVLRHLLVTSNAIHWREVELHTTALRALERVEAALRKRANGSFKPKLLRN